MVKKVRIIIPNVDGQNYLPECLNAVMAQDYESFCVTLVDCGSMDDSVKLVQENYPQVEIIRHNENLGMCAAVNEIVIRAQEEYIAVLQPDAVVDSDWLRMMVAAMAEDEKIFSLAPVVLYPHNPSKVKQAGLGYTLAGTAFGLNSGRKASKMEKKRVFASPDCGVLYRRSAFLHADGFDKNFFALGADVDICWRAAKAGFKTMICPDAHMIRKAEQASFDPDTRARLEARNNVWTIYKNMPLIQRFFTGWVIALGSASRKRLAKSSKKAYKQGLIEGKRSRRRLCKRFRARGSFFRDVRIKSSMVKYSLINFVRFPK